ncbi:MAG: hypothetical protein JSR34_12805 [Proteobacteria bacterium]|nr:hypothetical protein [Pseudomonadota bacterium]
MTPTTHGTIRTLHFDWPAGSWLPLADARDQTCDAYLLYDPFEPDEHTFLRWRRIERATMEALIGSVFEDADFHAVALPHVKPPRIGCPLLQFPDSWDVMF